MSAIWMILIIAACIVGLAKAVELLGVMTGAFHRQDRSRRRISADWSSGD